ncbi:hypothetical protein ABIB68_004174 [Bradyrhizobium sp. F1.2.2]
MQYVRENSAGFDGGQKNMQSQENATSIRRAASPITMRRRVKRVLMCPGARHAPLGQAAQHAITAGRAVFNARSGLRSKVEWRLARTRDCGSARCLHLHNRPLHMRSDFRSSLPSRKVLCHRPLRRIRRHHRMALQQQMPHHAAPQVRHRLQVPRCQRTPTLQRMGDRCRRTTGPCRRHALLRSVRLNAQWPSKSAMSTAAAS